MLFRYLYLLYYIFSLTGPLDLYSELFYQQPILKNKHVAKVLVHINHFFSCCTEIPQKELVTKTSDGIVIKGKVIADSLYNGRIEYYDSLNQYPGYSNYKFGLKDGVEVSYYLNGKISDSSFYRNGMRNGFAYNFQKTGKLSDKGFYLNGRSFGPAYEYDDNGNIKYFSFVNFERKLIFQSKKIDSVIYNKDEFINANIYGTSKGGDEIDVLFLYLVLSPFIKSHYELAILNNKKKIISSKRILSNTYYIEQELPDLPEGNKYAVVLYTYNPFKDKDDLIIRIIE